jgi:hypothetical protein
MIFRLAAVCLTVICGCCSESLLAQNSSPSPTPPTPSLERRVTDLEKRLQAIESIPLVTMALNMKGSAPSSEASPTPQSNSPLELVSWQYQFKPGQYAILNEHLFSYVLRNRSEKAIKLIAGGLTFSDLLGERLIAIKLLPDIKCAAGGTASSSGSWQAGMDDASASRLRTLSHDDIKATLTIQKVVFSDNTIWSSDNSQQ